VRDLVTDLQYGNIVTPQVLIDGEDVTHLVIQLGEIAYAKKASLLCTSATVTIEMVGDTLAEIGKQVVVNAKVNVSQPGGKTLTLFRGVLASCNVDPVTGSKTVSAETTRIFEKEIKARAQAVDYPFMLQDGPDLPIVFGSGVKYAPVEAWPRVKLTLQTPVDEDSESCLIDGGADVLQGTTVKILVAGIVMTGTFDDEVFTIESFNDPFYAASDSLSLDTLEDTDEAILATKEYIVDQFVYFASTGTVNYCYKQSGERCFFLIPFTSTETVAITETSYCQRPSWNAELDLAAVAARFWTFDTIYMFQDLIVLQPGSAGCIYDALEYNGKYVLNVMADTELVRLYGWADINGIKQLAPLPLDMFTVANQEITNVGTCTVLTIWPPLSTRANSIWSDEILVTVRSPVARTANAVASWLATYAGGNSTGSFGSWSVDCVFYGNQVVLQMLETLAYETCTPILIDGTTVTVSAATGSIVDDDDNRLSITSQTPDEFNLISKLVSDYRINYKSPIAHYTKVNPNEYTNEQTHQYQFLTNKVGVITSTDWWFERLTDRQPTYSYVISHTGYSLEAFDVYNGYTVEQISYDLIEPKVSLTCGKQFIKPIGVTTADPAKNTDVPLFIFGTGGAFQDTPEEPATQGWIFDGNTVFAGTANIYGCQKYLGLNIRNETPNNLPALGASETAGDWASGVPGICRVYTGVDSLGRMKFVYGYSPSIPYWLVTQQTITLGSPIQIANSKKVYPIIWSAT